MKNRPVIIDGKEEWLSRSIAAVAYVFASVGDNIYVLANKRGKGLPNNVGKWNAPSGFLDYDEDLADCAVREVYEETGIVIDNYANYSGDLNSITTEHSEPNEVEEVKWIPIQDIDKYEWTSEAHLANIRRAISHWFVNC